MNFAYQELEIDRRNPFSKMTIVGEGLDVTTRGTFTDQELRDGYEQSMNSLTGIPLLFPILGETGSLPLLGADRLQGVAKNNLFTKNRPCKQMR